MLQALPKQRFSINPIAQTLSQRISTLARPALAEFSGRNRRIGLPAAALAAN
ncbi:hypothetical protein [Flavimaricola marinus]|uniref:hypothetical protein n=1 Tax=Flavimaricola marinus TaxID=1819565 RepID=UPI00145529D4|nr:hypothetical protein [Flavimaricola marinus]